MVLEGQSPPPTRARRRYASKSSKSPGGGRRSGSTESYQRFRDRTVLPSLEAVGGRIGSPPRPRAYLPAARDSISKAGWESGRGSYPSRSRSRGMNLRAGRVRSRSQLSTVHGLQPIRCPTSFWLSPRSSRRFRSCSPRVTGSLGYCGSTGFGPLRTNWQKGNAGVPLRLAGTSEARLHVRAGGCGALSCESVGAGDGSH